MFCASLAEVLPGLRNAIERQDWDEACGIAHRMRGSACMYGFGQVSAAAAALEGALARAKGGSPVKGSRELTDSAQTLVHFCEQALSVSPAREGGRTEQ